MRNIVFERVGNKMTDEAFIQRAFIVHKGTCVPAMALHYLNALRSGSSRASVWGDIAQCSKSMDAGSDKSSYDLFLKGLASLDNEKFLEQAYLRILGRLPDASGSKHYLGCISGGENRDKILLDLILSGEGQSRIRSFPALRNLERHLRHQLGVPRALNMAKVIQLLSFEGDLFLQRAYLYILGREADSSGIEAYRGELQRGVSKLKIVGALANSEEAERQQKTVAVRIFFWSLRIPYGVF